MPENPDSIFLSEQPPATRRWAILEDDGVSAWLYITEPYAEKPAAHCFVYNRIPPIPGSDIAKYRNGPPPVTVSYASEEAHWPTVDEQDLGVTWSEDGSVAVASLAGEPVAMLRVGERRGYSKALSKEGPFGKPWNDDVDRMLEG